MTTDYMWIYPHRTVAATIAKIRELAPETEFIYYLYVTDQSQKLLGVLSLRTLLLSLARRHDPHRHGTRPRQRPRRRRARSTSPRRSRATICWPVRSSTTAGKMLGIVTVDDAIDAIIPERLKKQLPRFTHGTADASESRR